MDTDATSADQTTPDQPWFSHYAPGVPQRVEIPEIPLTTLLSEAARRFPGSSALNFFGNCIPYAKLDEQANRCANALIRLGVQKGDRVAIMLPNLPQCVMAYYGALRAGAVVVFTNPMYTTHELARQLDDSGAKVLIALDLFRERIVPILHGDESTHKPEAVLYCGVREHLPTLKKLFYPFKAKRDGMWAPFTGKAPEYDFAKQLELAAVTQPLVRVAADDVALLQYTGGTTGIPKGVILTHRNLVANTLQCQGWMPGLVNGQERFLSVIPFFHVYGMTTCMNLAVRTAGEMVLLPKFHPEEVLSTIDKARPTVFPGIQAMYLAIGNHPKAEKHNLTSIRACISGAGPLQNAVRERFESLTGATLVEGYGLSEASPVTHANPIGGTRVEGAIGLPFPSTEAKVVDDTGADLPQGEVGELVVRGPQVMQGYWNRSEETLRTLEGGWLHTGDMARMDDAGFFYMVDRKKDMIKTGGENVYPRDVEEVLFAHPDIKEAVVAGLPDDFLGERIKAYIVLTDSAEISADEIIAYCTEKLARFKVPKEIAFRTELPKTIVGKVLRRMLIEEELNAAEHKALPEPAASDQPKTDGQPEDRETATR